MTSSEQDDAGGTPLCPRCRTRNIVPMVYGLSTPDVRAAAKREELSIGGERSQESEWRCVRCGFEWPGGSVDGSAGRFALRDITSPPRPPTPMRVLLVGADLGEPIPGHRVELDRIEFFDDRMEFRMYFVPGLTDETTAGRSPFDFIWKCEVLDDLGRGYRDEGGGYSSTGGERSKIDRCFYPAPGPDARTLTVVSKTPNGDKEAGGTVVSLQ